MVKIIAGADRSEYEIISIQRMHQLKVENDP